MDTALRTAQPADTPGMAHVYLAAFPDSIRHFFADRPPQPQAVADMLLVPLLAEPGCGWVAEAHGSVVGYCLAPAHVSRLPGVLWRGHLSRMLGRWLAGAYGVGLPAAARLARNSLTLSRRDPHHVEAHILSLAVHPDWQGRGLGRELLQRSLESLERRGARRVRLEVRPDNAAATRLYEKLGFVAVGRTHDSQGEWSIMIREGET